ncbi:MAG: hypothetical protein RIS35_2616 [Pseudomonadota bacterium]
MSDPIPDSAEVPVAGRAAAAGATSRGVRSGNLAVIALVLAAAAAAAVGVFWQRSDAVSREAARRLQQGDARAAQLETQLRQSQEVSRDLQARAAVLESKLSEVLAQQSQLEQMYRSISQGGIEAALGDVENAVGIASQQLSVSGNIRGAILALQDADARLKRINQPEAVGLRRLIARDLDRLRAVPNVDVVALVLRLEAVASSAGQLPLVSSLGEGAPESAPDSRHALPDEGFSLERIAQTGWQGWRALVRELTQLFRVNRVDAPEAMLLAPEQRYFVRENLRLTLLSARLSLLARAEPVFRADLGRAIDWLERYYDRDHRGVANAVATLRQLESSRFVSELPSLVETVSAVRAARAARGAS